MSNQHMKEKKVFSLFVAVFIIAVLSCILRKPNFDTAVWAASDTNYQVLMNAKAMIDADEAIAWLPLITFSEDTDYGLEYSSGAFDKNSGKFFYYVSFPAFPFQIFVLFLKITGLDVSLNSMYIFCSILFIVSSILVTYLFYKLFKDSLNGLIIISVSGLTYLFSFEIMQSMGLTYWGHNWYMIFFPIMCISFMNIENEERISKKNLICFLLLNILIMQTEWTGYFAVAGFWFVFAYKKIRNKTKKYDGVICCIVVEVCISIIGYILVNSWVVGFSEFVDTVLSRASGRSRGLHYSLFEVECNLFKSFGAVLILGISLIIWFLFLEIKNKQFKFIEKKYYVFIVIFTIPLFENHIFVNHALTYSMDRMKWYFLLEFILLWLISQLVNEPKAKQIIFYTISVVMGLSFLAYRFVENDYVWNDEKLKDSVCLEKYIEENYSDNTLGQLTGDSVWGYSKILFGHGILKETSMDEMKDRASELNKRYAIGLNNYNLSYTQMWYSSAIIYDSVNNNYILAGALSDKYIDKINDLSYLYYASEITITKNGFSQVVDEIKFSKNDSINDKITILQNRLRTFEWKSDRYYYVAEMDKIPNIIIVDNQNIGEWSNGTSTINNRLIFLNNSGNRALLSKATYMTTDSVTARVEDVFTVDDFIYVDLDTQYIQAFSYPNAIYINYGEIEYEE